jgi:hypothetical protein
VHLSSLVLDDSPDLFVGDTRSAGQRTQTRALRVGAVQRGRELGLVEAHPVGQHRDANHEGALLIVVLIISHTFY